MLGAIYGLSEIALLVTRRSGARTKSHDRNSLALLWVVIFASIALGIWMGLAYPGATLPYPRVFYFIGLLLFIGGVALRWYSIWRLGRFFTVDVAIANQHRLIDSGPYRIVRHPSYTGALIAFVGFGFCLGNWWSILCVIVPITAAFLWRIRIEERALADALGHDYGAYVQRTKRLLPFVY